MDVSEFRGIAEISMRTTQRLQCFLEICENCWTLSFAEFWWNILFYSISFYLVLKNSHTRLPLSFIPFAQVKRCRLTDPKRSPEPQQRKISFTRKKTQHFKGGTGELRRGCLKWHATPPSNWPAPSATELLVGKGQSFKRNAVQRGKGSIRAKLRARRQRRDL
jgi:hypothetical protein